jgi:hypothetical protein
MKPKFAILALAALTLAGCGDNELPPPTQTVNVSITLEVPEGTAVRRVPVARVSSVPLPEAPRIPSTETKAEPEGTLFDVAP